MNHIRKAFGAEVETLAPVLHEAYRRIGVFQKNRTMRNQERLVSQFEALAPHLAFFATHVPEAKQGYFTAFSDASLDISDRIVALDVAVGSLHIAFPIERAYMHRESARLRDVLERSRWAPEDHKEPQPSAWVAGLGASPGQVTAAAHVATRNSDFRRIPDGSVLVTTMPRPEMTPVLGEVEAIVAERGGMLCHAAIVARELGIPCVVGAAGATKRIRTGQLVTVDGAAGTVELASTTT